MPLPAIGGVYLDGIRFTTDPEPYEPMNWPKRMSVHQGMGGAVTIQDFGVFQRDLVLKLASGTTRPLEETAMLALHGRYRSQGLVYPFSDWLGNSFSVFIERFRPWPLRRGGAPGGASSLWLYEMDLHVLAITQLVGAAFTGL